jgi:hypothetical protein
MATLFGFNAFLRCAKEDPADPYATANTTSSQQVDLRLNSSTLQTSQERPRKTNLSVPATGMLASTFDAFRNSGGTIDIPIQYDASGMLIEGALGTSATVAAAPYHVHTYSPAFALPAYTIQFQRGSNLNNSMEQFTGVMVSSMAVSVAAGEEMTCSFDLIGKDSGTRTTNISSSFSAGDSVLHFEAGAIALAGTLAPSTFELRSFELTLDNKLERKNILGSKMTAQPVISDVREVTMAITADMDDNDIYVSQLDGKSGTVSIKFTSTANSNHHVIFTLTNAVIEDDYSDSVTSFGRVERSFTIRGLASSTDNGLTIEIKNSNPSSTIGL